MDSIIDGSRAFWAMILSIMRCCLSVIGATVAVLLFCAASGILAGFREIPLAEGDGAGLCVVAALVSRITDAGPTAIFGTVVSAISNDSFKNAMRRAAFSIGTSTDKVTVIGVCGETETSEPAS